ncbi:hypothetical protein ACRAWB_16330 [Leifsonia poae]
MVIGISIVFLLITVLDRSLRSIGREERRTPEPAEQGAAKAD